MRQHGDVERHPLAELMDRPFKELVTLTHTALGECLTNAGVTSEGGLILSRLDVACAFDAVCFLEVIVALLPSITIARNLKGNP